MRAVFGCPSGRDIFVYTFSTLLQKYPFQEKPLLKYMGQQKLDPDSPSGKSIRYESEGWGFESPSGRDISVSNTLKLSQEHPFVSRKWMLLPVHIYTTKRHRPPIIQHHYSDVIKGAITSQIISFTIDYSDADQMKYQSSASLAFVRGSPRGPVNFPHKWPVTRKMLPFDDVIMFMD